MDDFYSNIKFNDSVQWQGADKLLIIRALAAWMLLQSLQDVFTASRIINNLSAFV